LCPHSAELIFDDLLIEALGRFPERDAFVLDDRGFNVSPREIEEVIATAAPGVLATAVIGLPHDKWGEVVTAFVVAREGQAVDVQALATIRTRKGPTRFRRRSTPWMSSHRPLPGRSTRTAARAAHDGELTFCRDQT